MLLTINFIHEEYLDDTKFISYIESMMQDFSVIFQSKSKLNVFQEIELVNKYSSLGNDYH